MKINITSPSKWHRSNIWLILSMVAVALSSGRLSFALPAWFVPLLGLRYLQTNPNPFKTRLFRLAAVTWVALSASWYGGTPLWGLAHFVFMAMNAAFTILPYAIYLWLRKHLGDQFWTTLFFAIATTAIEYITISGSPFGSFGAGAYSQYGFLALLQFLSIGGMLSITFLIAWSGAVADWAVEAYQKGRRFVPAVAIWAVVLASVVGCGAFRLSSAPAPGAAQGQENRQIVAAGLTAQPVDMHELSPLLASDLDEFRSRTAAVHREYLEMSATAASEGADLIVWPELAGTGTFADVAELLEESSAFADEYDVHLAVSTMELDPEGTRQAVNKVSLFGPDGLLLAEHVKFGGNFMEGTLPGAEQITTVDTAIGRVGLAICWDFDFHKIVAETGRDSVDLLIVPAADWQGIDPLHGHMALFRTIENGTTLVRQAQNGLSIIADPYGRVIDTGDGPANAIQATIAPSSIATVYPGITNLIGLICSIVLAVAAVVAFVQRRSLRARNTEAVAA